MCIASHPAGLPGRFEPRMAHSPGPACDSSHGWLLVQIARAPAAGDGGISRERVHRLAKTAPRRAVHRPARQKRLSMRARARSRDQKSIAAHESPFAAGSRGSGDTRRMKFYAAMDVAGRVRRKSSLPSMTMAMTGRRKRQKRLQIDHGGCRRRQKRLRDDRPRASGMLGSIESRPAWSPAMHPSLKSRRRREIRARQS